jgi:hypothetical protein
VYYASASEFWLAHSSRLTTRRGSGLCVITLRLRITKRITVFEYSFYWLTDLSCLEDAPYLSQDSPTSPELSLTSRRIFNREMRGHRTMANFVRFKVFTAVTMKNCVFWDVTLCGSCKNRRFGGT